MRKKFNLKSTILGIVIGGIVFGSIGVVATNYLLKAEDVEYKNNKNLQDAIDELYGMASNNKNNNEELPISSTNVSGPTVTISYTGTYPIIYCVYGTDENYGSIGNISNNKCVFTGNTSTKYYYKLMAIDNTGKMYEYTNDATTGSSGAMAIRTNLPTGVQAIVYLDPSNISNVCNASNSVSSTGIKTGCMKWYAYKLENNKYTMILDHNTTAKVPYNTTNSNENYGTTSGNVGYDLAQLTSISGWKMTPRLITADEIASIVGYTDWTSSTNTNSFYFDSKTGTQTANATNKSAYAWLFDYTNGCTSYGCNTADSSTYGYWTSSKTFGYSNIVWTVIHSGYLDFMGYGAVGNTNSGLRPVIEVPSSILNIS